MKGKDIKVVTNRNGKRVRLMNPQELADKAAYELKTNMHVTNFGNPKVDKDGVVQSLTDTERAFRGGMLRMRKSQAAAYRAKTKASTKTATQAPTKASTKAKSTSKPRKKKTPKSEKLWLPDIYV